MAPGNTVQSDLFSLVLVQCASGEDRHVYDIYTTQHHKGPAATATFKSVSVRTLRKTRVELGDTDERRRNRAIHHKYGRKVRET